MRDRGPGFDRRVTEAVAKQPETENCQRQHATGRKQQPGKVVDRSGGLKHHAAPARRRWWNTEAQEVYAGLDNNRDAREERELNHHWAKNAGQYVRQDDACVAKAGDSSGGYVELLADAEYDAAHDARHTGRAK